MWITVENTSSLIIHTGVIITILMLIIIYTHTPLEHTIIDTHSQYISKHIVEQIQFLPDELRTPIKTQVTNIDISPDDTFSKTNNKINQKCIEKILYMWLIIIVSIVILKSLAPFELTPILISSLVAGGTLLLVEYIFSAYFIPNYRIVDPNAINYAFYSTLRNYSQKCGSKAIVITVTYGYINPNGKISKSIGTLYVNMKTNQIYINYGNTRWLLLPTLDLAEIIKRFTGLDILRNTLPTSIIPNSLVINDTGKIPIFYTAGNTGWNRLYNTTPTPVTVSNGMPTTETTGSLYLDRDTNMLFANDGGDWTNTQQVVATGTTEPPTQTSSDVYVNVETNSAYVNTGTDWMII